MPSWPLKLICVLFYLMDILHIQVVVNDTVNYTVKVAILDMCSNSLAHKGCFQWRNDRIWTVLVGQVYRTGTPSGSLSQPHGLRAVQDAREREGGGREGLCLDWRASRDRSLKEAIQQIAQTTLPLGLVSLNETSAPHVSINWRLWPNHVAGH